MEFMSKIMSIFRSNGVDDGLTVDHIDIPDEPYKPGPTPLARLLKGAGVSDQDILQKIPKDMRPNRLLVIGGSTYNREYSCAEGNKYILELNQEMLTLNANGVVIKLPDFYSQISAYWAEREHRHRIRHRHGHHGG